MKKTILLFLPFFLFLAGTFVSCEEVKEAGKYDNWKERNEAYIDSIKHETGEAFVATLDQVKAIPEGKLFAIQTSAGTTVANQYVYCKKINGDSQGNPPLFTGTVTAFYYGTYIIGSRFDGNFLGYSALDKTFNDKKEPTDFDSPALFKVSGVIAGWTAALQYMTVGERWMLYVPWQSGYGSSDYSPPGSSSTIPGYSTLTFDVILKSIV